MIENLRGRIVFSLWFLIIAIFLAVYVPIQTQLLEIVSKTQIFGRDAATMLGVNIAIRIFLALCWFFTAFGIMLNLHWAWTGGVALTCINLFYSIPVFILFSIGYVFLFITDMPSSMILFASVLLLLQLANLFLAFNYILHFLIGRKWLQLE
jgi:hypothetical protein